MKVVSIRAPSPQTSCKRTHCLNRATLTSKCTVLSARRSQTPTPTKKPQRSTAARMVALMTWTRRSSWRIAQLRGVCRAPATLEHPWLRLWTSREVFRASTRQETRRGRRISYKPRPYTLWVKRTRDRVSLRKAHAHSRTLCPRFRHRASAPIWDSMAPRMEASQSTNEEKGLLFQ